MLDIEKSSHWDLTLYLKSVFFNVKVYLFVDTCGDV